MARSSINRQAARDSAMPTPAAFVFVLLMSGVPCSFIFAKDQAAAFVVSLVPAIPLIFSTVSLRDFSRLLERSVNISG